MAHLFIDDLGQEMAVVDGIQMPVLTMDLSEIPMNWFEGSQLVIGCRDDPGDVEKWQAWNKAMEEWWEAHQYDIEIDVLPDEGPA